MYYIWCDESDKHGRFYSNFYGGMLIRSKDLAAVLEGMRNIVGTLGIDEEIKWQKVNEYHFDNYVQIVDYIFDLLKDDLVKIRIFFHQNQYVPKALTNEQKRNEYAMLYYQFIKNAFGFEYSTVEREEPTMIGMFLDDIPMKGEDKEVFFNWLLRLNSDPKFKVAGLSIRKSDIVEVDSKRHLPLQMLDLILGAMCFRLNDKHLEKNETTGRRGKRTIVKEKLYKYINRKICELRPNFNIGISTGFVQCQDRWTMPYRHWNFIPSEHEIDVTYTKAYTKK